MTRTVNRGQGGDDLDQKSPVSPRVVYTRPVAPSLAIAHLVWRKCPAWHRTCAALEL